MQYNFLFSKWKNKKIKFYERLQEWRRGSKNYIKFKTVLQIAHLIHLKFVNMQYVFLHQKYLMADKF